MVGSDVPDHRLLKMTQLYFEIQSWIPLHTDSQYHAWVSGFNVSLDSIDIFERTVKITQYIREPPKRWGLGLHVGAGSYGTGNKIGPYIGIGISYNILAW